MPCGRAANSQRRFISAIRRFSHSLD